LSRLARPSPSSGSGRTATPTKAAKPWPVNTGTPLTANCSAPLLQQRRVYTPQQVQTAYGVDTLRARASGTPVITVPDLGGGWSPDDLELAGQCFGYALPSVSQTQGDGVAAAIAQADDETSLDLQTAAAVAPGTQVRLVQATLGGILDGFSRALGDGRGVPDVISLSFGGCALAEPGPPRLHRGDHRGAGDDGAGRRVLVRGGGRLRIDHLWDQRARDHVVASGGVSLRHRGRRHPAHPRPRKQPRRRDGMERFGVRRQWGRWRWGEPPAIAAGVPGWRQRAGPPRCPDVSALADIVPGWPVVINSTLQTVGGTSGSTPFVAAATALVAASERNAGRPGVGLANGWFYKAAAQPSAFFDVTKGNNDLAGVGCCQAAVGYDSASGLGVPNWAALPAALPQPG
jgi:hypothetical protein